MFPIISLMILFPFIGFALLLALPLKLESSRLVAAFFSGISLILGIAMLLLFNYGSPGLQMTQSVLWISTSYFPIQYSVGVDGIALPMVFLSVLLSFLVVVFSWDVKERSNQYFSMILLTEVGVLGVFTVTNYFVFYLFWEAVLIPMFFIILVWGSPRRVYSATKFFIYTHASSLVMLLSFFALYFQYHQVTGKFTFSMIAINQFSPAFGTFFQLIVFIGLFFGFIVKMPVFPFHTWLPDAHTDAPTGGSVLLAGLLIKMGSFGIIRIAIPALPLGAKMIEDWIVVLAVISILYGAWVSLAQKDIKRMIANSSISHMGLVLLAIAASVFSLKDTGGTWSMGNTLGITVADFQMFAHGLITAVLFMSAGVIQHHTGTRDVDKLSGIGRHMPLLSTFMMAGFLASLGLPGMVGFVAEFSVFYVTYLAFNVYLIIPIITVVITVGYYLWALQRTIFGPESDKLDFSKIHDSNWYEIAPMIVLVVVIVIFGIVPWVMFSPISGAVPHWYYFIGRAAP